MDPDWPLDPRMWALHVLGLAKYTRTTRKLLMTLVDAYEETGHPIRLTLEDIAERTPCGRAWVTHCLRQLERGEVIIRKFPDTKKKCTPDIYLNFKWRIRDA